MMREERNGRYLDSEAGVFFYCAVNKEDTHIFSSGDQGIYG